MDDVIWSKVASSDISKPQNKVKQWNIGYEDYLIKA